MKLPKFLVGLVIGGLLALIIWYWQKSTSAEDGALDVLDRYAASEARLRELRRDLQRAEAQTTSSSDQAVVTLDFPQAQTATEPDDLQDIDGIGPTYAQRLQEAGISTFADLAGCSVGQLQDITAVRSVERAQAWLIEAERRAQVD